jgi:hypothetical protein
LSVGFPVQTLSTYGPFHEVDSLQAWFEFPTRPATRQISNAGLPPATVAALKAAQFFGNYAVHHQDGGHIDVNRDSVQAVSGLFGQGLVDDGIWRSQAG